MTTPSHPVPPRPGRGPLSHQTTPSHRSSPYGEDGVVGTWWDGVPSLDPVPPIGTGSNPFEERQRATKVGRLVLFIERVSRGALTTEEWATIATMAGVKPPSETTIAQVEDVLATRARRSA